MIKWSQKLLGRVILRVRLAVVNFIKVVLEKYGTPPWLNEQTEYFLPSSWLGSAATGTTTSQNRIIANMFDEYARSWSAGSLQMPISSRVFQVDKSRLKELSGRPVSVSFVGPRYYVGELPLTVDNGGFPGFVESARTAGMKVYEFDVSQTLSINGYSGKRVTSQQVVNQELSRLRAHLRETKPDILVVDGNFVPGAGSYDAGLLADLKQEFGFSLCTFIVDFHELQTEDKLGYWGEVSDLVVFTSGSWSHHNKYYDRFSQKEKILLSPCPPTDESQWLNKTVPKDIQLGFWGGKGRRRTDYLDFATKCGIATNIVYREDVGRKSFDEYVEFLLRSKISFTSGFTGIAAGRRTGIMTYRIWESILAGALLIHESGSQIDEFLVPFVHFVPVDSVHELVHFSRFLLDNEKIAENISTQALAFYMEHYSSTKFWNRVRDMIDR